MSNLFSKRLDWLHGALGLTDPQLPTHLETDQVLPTLEAFQGGWSTGRWSLKEVIHTAAATALIRLTEPDLNTTRIILVSFHHANGAAGGSINFNLADPISGNGMQLKTGVDKGPADTPTGHQDIFGTTNPIVVPPGFFAQAVAPAMALGEDLRFRILALSVAAGSKPI